MKYLILGLISYSALAAISTSVDKVRTLDIEKGSYTVTLWGNNRVFRLSEKDKVIPCLENAEKSQMKVAVTIDSENGSITDCKLHSGDLPGVIKRR